MKAIPINEALYDYIVAHSFAPSQVLSALAHETRTMPGAGMQIAPDQGALMHLLVKLMGARRIVEVGCYTGYSAIAMASALPDDGRLFTLDINHETSAVAQRYFVTAGLEQKISLRLGPATESLEQLLSEFGPGSFDLMFIDADKANTTNYFELGLQLLRQGGLIICDNALWGGSVVDQADQDKNTNILRKFNDFIAQDERVEAVLLNVADGLYFCRKR